MASRRKGFTTAEIIEEICRDTQSEDESDITEEEASDDTDVTDKSGALHYCCNQGHCFNLRFPIYDHTCCPAHNLWLWLCSTNRKRVGYTCWRVCLYREWREWEWGRRASTVKEGSWSRPWSPWAWSWSKRSRAQPRSRHTLMNYEHDAVDAESD